MSNGSDVLWRGAHDSTLLAARFGPGLDVCPTRPPALQGFMTKANDERVGFNTMVYSESEVERIAHVAFQLARKRKRRLCSVEKSNVLEVSQLWKEVVTRVGAEYPDVALSHM
jgi:Isocitrate/isopropylmalate dehydrogenase